MRTVQFRNQLDQESALGVRFELESGQVQKFTVQLEYLIGGQWAPVVRYDTAHGFAHMDIMHPYDSAQKVPVETRDNNEALTLAVEDLTNNRTKYRRRYLQWLQNR